MRTILTPFLTLLAFVSSTHALAQTQVWNATDGLFRKPAADSAAPPRGWVPEATVNLNLSLSSSQDVVGQTDGTTQTYGTVSRFGLNHFGDHDEWRNDLFLREATTKNPNLPRFVKSDDELKLSTIYLYSLPEHPRVGPYARAEGAAPIFFGEDVRSEVKTYRIKSLEGGDRVLNASSLRLTSGFRPLTTKEATGFFFKAVNRDDLRVELRLGAAAQQIRARGSYAVKGTNSAGEIEVTELEDVMQAGLETGLALKGKANERTSYEVSAETMTPFVYNKRQGDDRDAWRLTNVEATAKLTSKVTDWVSFGYDYKLKLQPQLVDRAQQIHMIVFSLTYPVIPR